MTNNILYINSAVRAESRTNELAKYLLEKLDGNITELKLEDENLKPLNGKSLAERDFIIGSNNKDNEMLKYARQFAKADIIVIAAPFWDYSFPALLKTYIENISVLDTTFTYDEIGNAVGLCKAKRVYYVSTSGGQFIPDFGFNYLKRLFKELYGISDMRLFYAENLDIDGSDIPLIMKEAKEKIDKEEL